MTHKNGYLFAGFLVMMPLVAFLTFYNATGARVAVEAQDNDVRDLPILEYETETKAKKSKARKEKDERFNGPNNPGRRTISELPIGVEPLPTTGHWWIGLSAIPVEQSDVVVLGDIIAREAHLSGDQKGVYSDFTIQISEVFKDRTNSAVVGSQLSVSRLGGGVRFKSGRIQKYGLARQGMPRVGSQQVLFLRKSEGGDLIILTGYELSGGVVTPLDGEESKDPRSNLPFATYRGANPITLMSAIRGAVARSATGGGH